MKKVLVVTTRFPVPPQGACPQDRLGGILTLVRLGFEVYVIARISPYQDDEKFRDFAKASNFLLKLVPYESQKEMNFWTKFKHVVRRIINPLYLDGAAYEFSHVSIRDAVSETCRNWQPDAVWCDYTYTWPLYSLIKRFNIPIFTRAINFEPRHFLHENGYSIINLIKFVAKFFGELRVVRYADTIFSINPLEKAIYQRLGAGNVINLPLRGLPPVLRNGHEIRERRPLHVGFMGSTYTVFHNLKTLTFIVKEIVPSLNKNHSGEFFFHIYGKKVPQKIVDVLPNNVKVEGHVDDFDAAMDELDIALVPSLSGAGMQQKIFEPLARGIPTLTSPRGLVAYPFNNEEHLLLAKTPGEFVEQLKRLISRDLRSALSKESITLSQKLFSQNKLDEIIHTALMERT